MRQRVLRIGDAHILAFIQNGHGDEHQDDCREGLDERTQGLKPQFGCDGSSTEHVEER
ncbi:MAG: hypothetical protein JWL62_78 [Hyphomicrobiales bacterium]|nr:hypothetical protein [Hyphomicrobiales bacterium]